MLWYHVALEDSKEKICVLGSGMEERPIGSALIAFLDVDWNSLHKKSAPKCVEHGEAHCDGMELQAFYGELKRDVGARHPLLQIFVDDQLTGAWIALATNSIFPADLDFAVALRDGKAPLEISDHMLCKFWEKMDSYFTHFAELQEKLIPMMDAVLDAGNTRDLSQIQRYFLMRQTSPDYTILAHNLYSTLSLENAVLMEGQITEFMPGRELTDAFMAQLQSDEVSVHTFQRTDSMDAILLWELDYMASHGHALRRCEHCGRYFIPHSVVSRYCDRPTAERPEKTCKDIGAMTKHQAEVNANAAKKLYRQTNNRVHQWATRNSLQYPKALKENYKQWNLQAQEMRDKVIAGEVPYEEFEAAMTGGSKALLGV